MVLRVRPITNDEGNRLRTSIRHSDDLIEMKRAQVILASAQGFTVQKILVFSGMTEGYIRTLIHQFNTDGLAMFKPRWNPGDRHKYSKETRVSWWPSPPADLGIWVFPSVSGVFADYETPRWREESWNRSPWSG